MSADLTDAQVAYEIGFRDGKERNWKRPGCMPGYANDYLKGYEAGVSERTRKDKEDDIKWIKND